MIVKEEVFFILGCPRSGTTLINNLLREYLDIGFANELQLIPKYYPRIKKYGDLNIKKNLDALIMDLIQEPYFSIFEKQYSKTMQRHVKITRESILEKMPEASFAGVIYGVLRSTADQLGKKHVGNKHLSMGLHLDWLHVMFPNCKLIHVIRDGRDCALSLKRMRWGHANAYAAAKLWAQHIRCVKEFINNRIQNRYIEIRYEDFLNKTISEMVRLSNFIRGSHQKNCEKEFEEIKNQVKRDNVFKWKKQMSRNDIAIFQSVAGDLLSEYHYELLPVEKKLKSWQKLYYIIQNQFAREYKVRFRKDMPG